MLEARVRAEIERALSARVERVVATSGGDINQAWRVSLADGRSVFVKTNPRAEAEMFPAEARGLDWLAEAKVLRLPKVLAVSSGRANEPGFLVLELLEPSAPVRDFDQRLGRGLAALHRFGAPRFGLDHDNFIGSLPQANAPASTWPELYRERRLAPLAERAARDGTLPAATLGDFERLYARLDELVGPPEPPARLHGDLWGGNLHVDERGEPCLIDPAVYGGHREIDLAMMRLFGGFGEQVFAAYHEAYPLAPGHRERVPLYQLYPLLVHVNLFGGGYVGSLRRALGRYV